jgi:hypothetical protein
MENFESLFFNSFTRELIKNSAKADELSSQRLLKEKIKQRLQKKYNDNR